MTLSPNQKAFLDMIAASEGTAGVGDDGYNVIVGGALFHNGYVDHPRILVKPPKIPVPSTAAGRYQMLARWFDAYKKILNLHDFSPASQDAIAIRLISERGALPDIDAGRLEDAIKKVAKIWASLPGAGYGQHEHKAEFLRTTFASAGGTINT